MSEAVKKQKADANLVQSSYTKRVEPSNHYHKQNTIGFPNQFKNESDNNEKEKVVIAELTGKRGNNMTFEDNMKMNLELIQKEGSMKKYEKVLSPLSIEQKGDAKFIADQNMASGEYKPDDFLQSKSKRNSKDSNYKLFAKLKKYYGHDHSGHYCGVCGSALIKSEGEKYYCLNCHKEFAEGLLGKAVQNIQESKKEHAKMPVSPQLDRSSEKHIVVSTDDGPTASQINTRRFGDISDEKKNIIGNKILEGWKTLAEMNCPNCKTILFGNPNSMEIYCLVCNIEIPMSDQSIHKRFDLRYSSKNDFRKFRNQDTMAGVSDSKAIQLYEKKNKYITDSTHDLPITESTAIIETTTEYVKTQLEPAKMMRGVDKSKYYNTNSVIEENAEFGDAKPGSSDEIKRLELAMSMKGGFKNKPDDSKDYDFREEKSDQEQPEESEIDEKGNEILKKFKTHCMEDEEEVSDKITKKEDFYLKISKSLDKMTSIYLEKMEKSLEYGEEEKVERFLNQTLPKLISLKQTVLNGASGK